MLGTRRTSSWLLGVGTPLAALVGYFALWPIPVDPQPFVAPPNSGYAGPFARNTALQSVAHVELGPARTGPEDAAIDAEGRLYVSVRNGEILRFPPGGGSPEVFAHTGGVPLGLEVGPDGTLWVADAYRGLLSIDPQGAVSLRCDTAGGVPIRYADDVDIAADGSVYFTDASTKFGARAFGGTFPASVLDAIEHGRHGRLLRFDPRTDTVTIVRAGLAFANGLAIDRERGVLYLAETGLNRLLRVDISKGPGGPPQVLIDGLPGFPDNIALGREGRIWIGLVAPRNAVLDATASLPALRAAAQRLPAVLRPKPASYGHLIAVSDSGQVLHDLQHPDRYTHVTGALETTDALYITSLTEAALGRLAWPR
jgi:sugar lactone lactonase YvrE